MSRHHVRVSVPNRETLLTFYCHMRDLRGHRERFANATSGEPVSCVTLLGIRPDAHSPRIEPLSDAESGHLFVNRGWALL